MPDLSLSDISVSFGAVPALAHVDFDVRPGEVHALLGENGAGKSTLMNVAYGLVHPEHGSIRVGGRAVAIRSPRDARRLGIGMVHQHFTSIPALSVAENVSLTAGWRVSPAVAVQRVSDLAERFGLAVDPRAIVATLSAAQKQRIEIIKALAADTRFLLLDEPTGVLAPPEAESLLQRLKDFASQGIASVVITHKLDEALRVADRVTVLRRGSVVLRGPGRGLSAHDLASAMVGEPPSVPGRVRREAGPRSPSLRCDELAVAPLTGGSSGLRSVSLQVSPGEIVGVASIEGNGQRELFRALAGVAPVLAGRFSVEEPLVLIPEDRSLEGLIGEFTLTENAVLWSGARAPWHRGLWLDWGLARERTAELTRQFSIAASSPEAEAGSLSGGNQQRLIIGSALQRRPRVILAENPARGLDLRAAVDIYGRLGEAAANGAAVLLYSADVDELLQYSDRVLVLAAGVGTLLPAEASKVEIGRLMLRAASAA